jgi:hypothetical protein
MCAGTPDRTWWRRRRLDTLTLLMDRRSILRTISCDLTKLPIGGLEAFVLSQVSERSRVEDVADLVGLEVDEMLRVAQRLADLGALTVDDDRSKTRRTATSSRMRAATAPPASKTPSSKTLASKTPSKRGLAILVPSEVVPVPRRHANPRMMHIGPREAFVLSQIDGATSVVDLGVITSLSASDLSDALQALEAAGAVELPHRPRRSSAKHRAVVAEPPAPRATPEPPAPRATPEPPAPRATPEPRRAHPRREPPPSHPRREPPPSHPRREPPPSHPRREPPPSPAGRRGPRFPIFRMPSAPSSRRWRPASSRSTTTSRSESSATRTPGQSGARITHWPLSFIPTASSARSSARTGSPSSASSTGSPWRTTPSRERPSATCTTQRWDRLR